MMEIIGYLLSIFIGITLGLIGAGGSILTVPVLVYLFHVHPTLATSYSLFIVGFTSLIGSLIKTKEKCIDYQAVGYFGLSSVIVVLVVRKILLIHIPEVIIAMDHFQLTKSALTMIAFALLMLGSSWSMITNKQNQMTSLHLIKHQVIKMIVCGIGIGLVTGFLGAGGGFLIIPALVVLLDMPIKKAIGTSLMIITINSLIGFLGDMDHVSIDWIFLLKLLSVTIFGLFIGNYLQKKIAADLLKPLFGWFVLLMGIYILIKELF
ncbi:sulfite exporter TauE/SafE family protein [Sphingobacterium sp. SRCM116780]|uniref:sulfite exporter TauE/SafE family protein n=1 Tax=Sphingobacterium sp. SRCM116780 TaxID=2907623 RepID=UPI001F386CD2|nr:sulfite exporter TauE/SafE family protein [Sphingobacterium sp. SRCM116780]UIR57632.1 sulfite exporter TauE/SafE family protein [Sphingobacterium sp. SRCM116780]